MIRKRWPSRRLSAGLCLALVAFFPAGAVGLEERPRTEAGSPQPASPVIFRMAALAPEGSQWANAAREAARRIREETGDRVALRWFLGAAMGDEATMLASIRQGDLEGGVFSMVGLSRTVPAMALLSLPFLFRHEGETLEIWRRFTPVYQEKFLQENLVLLDGFSMGFGRLFTTKPAETLEQLTALRTWVWKGDPLGEAIFGVLGFGTLVSLDMTDVLPALNYDLLDAFSGTCYTISVFQWFPHARHMIPLNWGYTFGAIVVSRQAFSRLSTADQAVFRGVVSELVSHMEAESLRKEEESRRILTSVQGMAEISLPPADLSLLEGRAAGAYETVAEQVQARNVLQSILQALEEIREAPARPVYAPQETGAGRGPEIAEPLPGRTGKGVQE